jgi:hypothetical protein
MDKRLSAAVAAGDLGTVQRHHSLERTSPLGDGFVGRCVQCGMTGLSSPFGECKNPQGGTIGDSILAAIEGPEASLAVPIAGNSCEHGGDHPAPDNQRFCSEACSRCDDTPHDATKRGCAGICGATE